MNKPLLGALLRACLGALLASALFATSALAQTPPVPLGPGGGGGGGGASGGVTVGAAITGTCPNGDVLFSNSSAIGCEVVSGTGTVTSVGWTGGIVSIATPTTVPAFTIAGTSGGIPYFSSASTWASSAALAANALVVGGGAGAAPSTTTTGANVLTALGAAINASTGLPNVDGAITTGDCLKWGPGIQDAGAACGSGGGTLTVGTTATSGGAAGQLMFDTGSVLTESANLKFTTGLLINGATLPTNAAFALDYSPGANTATPGAAVINANVASTGNQQESCHLISGQGWKTTATASSEEVDTQLCTVPVQGAATPGPGFEILTQVNNAGYVNRLDYGITTPGSWTITGATLVGTQNVSGFGANELTVSQLNFSLISQGSVSNINLEYDSTGNIFVFNNSAVVGWSSSAVNSVSGVTLRSNKDTGTSRISAAVVGVGNGTAGSVSGQIKLAGLISASTPPTATFAGGTCAGGSPTPAATAGTVTLTGACAVTNTLTLSVMPSVPTGYACEAHDRTTPATFVNETSTTTTTVVFTFAGTTGASDIIQYNCTAGY